LTASQSGARSGRKTSQISLARPRGYLAMVSRRSPSEGSMGQSQHLSWITDDLPVFGPSRAAQVLCQELALPPRGGGSGHVPHAPGLPRVEGGVLASEHARARELDLRALGSRRDAPEVRGIVGCHPQDRIGGERGRTAEGARNHRGEPDAFLVRE